MQKFPKNFYFGAATSSHQVEGGNINNWSVWEKKNAINLAQTSKRRYGHLENYQAIKKQANDPNNYISGSSSDQIHRYKEDVRIMKKLNFNAYRFSIEWSRLEPKIGKFSCNELSYYQKLVDELRQNGIEPFITLWHWTVPIWFDKLGGFTRRKNVQYFLNYVDFVTKNLKGVKFWIILNEPEVITNKSYFLGDWPPQKKNPFLAIKVFKNLIYAHNNSYQIIKKNNPDNQVGIAKHNTFFEPYKNRIVNQVIAKVLDYFANHYFLQKTIKSLDFIGLNYYFHHLVGGKARNIRKTDMGWELYPKGIYYLLLDLKKYHKPIIICENGLADSTDKNRGWYIKEIIKNIEKSMRKGVNVRGYLHWSLLDNFEWADGFWPCFGLVKIDFKRKKRVIRNSAWEYAKIIKELKK
ncbi:MAG: glycoside hydrolase family 1 protein [Patescibacteria group bacterium]|nr:glycoside hydrolase family 1 protein [Patescibacteria group bacterium]